MKQEFEKIGIITRMRFGFPEMREFFQEFRDMNRYSRVPTRAEKAVEILKDSLHNVKDTEGYHTTKAHLVQKLKRYRARVKPSVELRETIYLRTLARALEKLLDAVYKRLELVDRSGDLFTERQRHLRDARRRVVMRARRGVTRIA